MSGFLTVGNNTKKAQFMSRSGSYSTHGSRSGRSFLYDFPLTPDQLDSGVENERRALVSRKRKLEERLNEIREILKLPPSKTFKLLNKTIGRYIGRNPVNKHPLFKEGLTLAEEAGRIDKRLEEIKPKTFRDKHAYSDIYRSLFIDTIYERLDEETLNEFVQITRAKIKEMQKEKDQIKKL